MKVPLLLILSSLVILSCDEDHCVSEDDLIIGNWLYIKTVSTDHRGTSNVYIPDTLISKNIQSYSCEGKIIDFNFWFDNHPSDSTIGTYKIDNDTLIINIYLKSPIDEVKELKYLYSFHSDTLIKEGLFTETGIFMISYLVRRSDNYLDNLLDMLDE